MSSSKKLTKRVYQFQIPLFLVSVIAGIIIAEYFTMIPTLTALKDELTLWGTIVAAFTLMFAFTVLLWSNIRRSVRRGERLRDRVRSLVLLAIFIVFSIVALSDPVKLTGSEMFSLLYTNTIGLASYGMLIGMHLVFTWAAIKKMQVLPNIETFIMFVFFVFEIFAEAMTVMPALWSPFGDIGVWIKTVPNMVGQRAAVAAAGIGGVILALRALVWREPGLIELEYRPEEK
ncbi:MAG: hypothetical protein QXF26_08770 [Candidatus Bathyarchaeia archaeon]